MRTLLFGSLVGVPLLAGAALYCQLTFAARVDPRLMMAWEIVAWGDLAVWVAAMLYALIRRPGPAELEQRWTPLGRRLADVWTGVVIAAVWLFLPAADGDLRVVVTVLAMTYVIILLLAGAETGSPAVPAIFGVLGSLATFFAMSGQQHGVALAVFLVWYAAAALVLRRFVHGALVQAKAGRAASEQALRLTAAERDARTSFIRAASHDLQQPIQAAGLYVDQAFSAPDPVEREAAAAGARRAVASTQALLGTMLDYLRLEAGAMPSRPQDAAVAPLLARVADIHRPAAQAAGMRLTALPSRHAARYDPDLAARALGNLVDNAIRHARGERILLAARRAANGMIDLWVLDDGEGVEPGDHDLFEDFAQGPGAGRGGFGLGLASVRRIADLMGGQAGHDRRWRAGAAFFLRVPEAACGSA